MSFETEEQGVETSQPREAYEIVTPAETWRLASGVRDVEIDGDTYTASPIRRSTVGVSSANDPQDMTLMLPVSHPLVQRYLSTSGPPITVTVRVYRQQLASGEYETIRYGLVTSLTCERNTASLLVSARAAAASRRRLPTVTVGRNCSHALYDSGCTVDRASFKVTTTIATTNGRFVTVASMGANPDDWATYGEFVRVTTGERMLIAAQTGTSLTLQLPLDGVSVGESVEIYAGCAHTLSVCRDKFDNIVNYGGMPHMPVNNVFYLNSRGNGLYEPE